MKRLHKIGLGMLERGSVPEPSKSGKIGPRMFEWRTGKC